MGEPEAGLVHAFSVGSIGNVTKPMFSVQDTCKIRSVGLVSKATVSRSRALAMHKSCSAEWCKYLVGETRHPVVSSGGERDQA